MADALEGPFPPEADLFADESKRRLVALCAALQAHVGDRPFWLSCRDAGAAIGISHVRAATLLKILVGMGLLIAVEAGEAWVGGKATRYRWVGSRP
jgi:hypothetical protein